MNSLEGQQMKPEKNSNRLLSVTRSKAKMIEYHVPEKYQEIDLSTNPAKLFTISISLLGDIAAGINRENKQHFKSIKDFRKNLLFSAHFFDSYLKSKLNEKLDPYLILLGSASYYLSKLPGSATVLASSFGNDCPDLGGESLEKLLHWLLKSNLSNYFSNSVGLFGSYVDSISRLVIQFFKDGTGEDKLINLAKKLRALVYELGTPRQLLFGDVVAALLREKIQNSSWKVLPLYSGLSKEKWEYALQKKHFIKELWPAQHRIGQAGILKGKSAIIQMPTSAGKTKAIELIIRSAFLSERTFLAIIVAPFRALCHEIKNSLISAFYSESTKIDELSDVLQDDYEINKLLGHQQILVVTPEKLLYLLRHVHHLISNARLVIFDEGHQFDCGKRGITYELLLTSLRSMLPEEAQKVLISAVISNAESVGKWLNGYPKVVDGSELNPTFKSVGFTSWLDQLGKIEYVDSRNAEHGEFFVPRVIEKIDLGRRGKEKKNRFFPEKSDGQAIALYLGLKLTSNSINSSVAIFCGRKLTAAKVCEKAVEIIERGIPLQLPLAFSDRDEVERLHNLHIENLGLDAIATRSSVNGIFSHHGNTPHGIRLAIEHAMRENLIKFVVCTSTLAQGVNLPIRYLILTSVYQGMERIKVRDFHNLIGRVGRAGMHTEGSILFADPSIYDKRKTRDNKWRWEQVKKLLESRNSEPCISNLLSIFDKIKSEDNRYEINIDALDFARAYIKKTANASKLVDIIFQKHSNKGFTRSGVKRQVLWKISLISSIESFLLSHWDISEEGLSESDVLHLAEETLAYFLADEKKRDYMIELFKLLAGNISAIITDPNRRRVYGRTLYGIQDAQSIERWMKSNIDNLITASNEIDILFLVWPLMIEHIHNSVFLRFDKPEVLSEVAQGWMEGKSFYDLLILIQRREVKMIWGYQRRKFKIDHMVDICESGLSYEGSLVVTALIEFLEFELQGDDGGLKKKLQLFQKRIKYGLSNNTSIIIYELGLADRVIAQKLALILGNCQTKNEVIHALKLNKNGCISVLEKYPKYFSNIYKKFIR